MKAVRLSNPASLDNLAVVDIDKPSPQAGQILVKARASSLNFHDYLVVTGGLPVDDGRIPMSDVAGEVVEVGAGVREFTVGDTVIGTFFPTWLSGEPTLAQTWGCIPGDSMDGYAAEFVCGAETSFTHAPAGYTMEEAATLPCAAVTAWRALFAEGELRPGETVLVQGTGGVSIFALQLAKAAGATVIATSSSDEKLDRVKAMGADHLINYKTTPEWGKAAAALCPRGGVDHIIEVGGPGTMTQSIAAARVGGHISLIGVLTGMAGEIPTAAMMMHQLKVKGITVGTREHQQQLVRALDNTGIKPVIDSSFGLDEIADAFRHQASQKHFGKICLSY
ncbi:NAD(P)-dependent alcohol dehydrogenase [Spectribacter hydrogenoxidans]|uniref:NAD(P)-dependent alcohol dehydrogenase n=1 Tax=Spectribacter hydrogenoxidans TaxID=3075608 RepID=A0ABU3BVX0_9GAMM|nr:NAD(P)-dependent alcohol dehydrogenase [Salinisphaera sp. W335]MDT0633437.1 NAD(P)-dependent alcohol dehydrogenase [Salinisphaera sp. W335]